MESDTQLREQLLAVLRGGNAHMSFDEAVAGFPAEHRNTKPPHVSYTPWHLLEHLRIAQWDILEFMRDPQHITPPWPEGHWPHPDAEADDEMWEATLAGFRRDFHTIEEIVLDSKTNLFAVIPHGDGQTILREILLVADHNAYHIGEFAVLRQVMQTWGDQDH